MPEIALHFEQIAVRFSPAVLIAVGLACVVAGLFVWLGGLGARKVLLAVAGAVSGGICGFFIGGQNIVLAAVSAAVTAFFAVIFERIFTCLLATVIAAAFGFTVLARPYIEDADILKHYPVYGPQNKTERLDAQQTAETMKAYMVDFGQTIKQACSQMPMHSWLIMAALVLVFIAAGFLLWQVTSALCYATLGTLLIFAGMILLLLYKGAMPISSICQRHSFFLAVLAAMLAFGTTEQLLLCYRIGAKATTRKAAKKNKREDEETRPNWRTV
jgi:hypothetical protein